MSIHVCKCTHNFSGQEEFHLRYPGMSEEAAQDIADAINSGALQPYFDELAKKKERVVLEPPVPGSIPREEIMEAVAKVRLAEKPRSQCTCSCHSYPEGTVKHMFPCCRPDTAIDHIVKA